MAERALALLTDAQRECLRLVYAHHNSKEIAVIVGVSPSAVDKRIERAVQQLGVPSRFAAARMLAVAENSRGAYERLPSEQIDLSRTRIFGRSLGPDGPAWLVLRLLGLSPSDGGGGTVRNPLGKLQRLGVVVGLIFLIAMSSVALLNLGHTLSSIASESRSAPGR